MEGEKVKQVLAKEQEPKRVQKGAATESKKGTAEEAKKKRIPYFNLNKRKRAALATYLNQGIIEKFPDTTPESLLTKSNILKNMGHDDTVVPLPEVCAGLIKVILKKHPDTISQRLWTPQLLVLEPDTYTVINQIKSIGDIINDPGFLKGEEAKIKLHQLFAKHKKIDLQAKQLTQLGTDKKIINIVVSTPNRLTKLADLKALDFSQLKYVIIDCAKNVKNQTLLDYRETRSDTMEFLAKCLLKPAVHNKVKIYFH